MIDTVKPFRFWAAGAAFSIITVLAAAPERSFAQHWVDHSACSLHAAEANLDLDFDDEALAQRVKRAERGIPNSVGKFWHIESPSGKVSHLWGTYHSRQIEFLRLIEPLKAYLATARVVALEINENSLTRRQARKLNEGSLAFEYARNKPFWNSLSESTQKLVVGRLSAFGIGDESAQHMTAFGMISALLVGPCDDLSASYPIMDARIQMMGEEAGAEILSLESPWSLVNFATSAKNEQTAAAIVELLSGAFDKEGFKKSHSAGYAIYRTGRLTASLVMDEVYLEHRFGKAKAAEILRLADGYLLKQRNETFLKAVLGDLREGGVVMAVGFLHLIGESGLVALLRGEGFKMTRIVLPGEAPSP